MRSLSLKQCVLWSLRASRLSALGNADDPDAAPPWAHLFQFQADRISQAAEALERLINREVLPLVRDFESVRAGVKK